MTRFDILTLFPPMFVSPFQESLLKKAQEKGLIEIRVINIRDFTEDKHHLTDDYPFGGGEGMVMKVEPIVKALQSLELNRGKTRVVLLTPQGRKFDQSYAQKLVKYPHLVFICGRYEGIDERIVEYVDEEVSIGDYILSGGELAAMVIIEVISRLIPGIVGKEESIKNDTFSKGLLKYPQYTRPRRFEGKEVPPLLLSGNHQKIEEWRRQQSLKKTLEKRPDLLEKVKLFEEERKLQK